MIGHVGSREVHHGSHALKGTCIYGTRDGIPQHTGLSAITDKPIHVEPLLPQSGAHCPADKA